MTAPHLHGGGGPGPNADPSIRPLGLTPTGVDSLLALLKTLTDPQFQAGPR